MSRKMIATAVAAAVTFSSAAIAQPYPGGPHPGGPRPGVYDDGRGRNGCYAHERPGECRERLRAERRYHRSFVYRDGRYEDRDTGGAAVAAGILGFILGAAIAGSSHDQNYYEAHRNDADWRARCRAAYRSFDARTGTYLGADGYRRYCTR
ncbi:MAG: BA14K family protein [Proteobacteria bacterium]|nr:BA14K family protein [Pseudomonadota bacterium]